MLTLDSPFATTKPANTPAATFNMDHQWLPFTGNRHFKQEPRIFVAAEGMHFTTHDGRQVIDGISSLWCVGAGHNRKPIAEAIKKQLDTLDYATAFQISNDQAFQAAQMIADLCPGDLNKVLFPAPLGPTMATNCPSPTLNDTSARA